MPMRRRPPFVARLAVLGVLAAVALSPCAAMAQPHPATSHAPLAEAALALPPPADAPPAGVSPSQAAADQPPPGQPPAAAPAAPLFPLEAIRVDGLRRAKPRVVLAASRLAAGSRVDEAELARAVARVQRLPFVLDARFRLERGSERGRYVLVIEVVETRRFFFGGEVAATRYGRPLDLQGASGEESDLQLLTLAGIRQTIGGAGELTASLASEEGFQVAYTHYDLFGRGAVGGVAVSDRGYCCGSAVLPLGLVPELSRFSLNDEEEARLHLAVPFRGDHAWRATVDWSRAADWSSRPVLEDPQALRVAGRDFERRAVGLGWSFDDTDDPLLPLSGRRAEAGVERVEVSYRPEGAFRLDPDLPAPDLGGVELDSALTRVHFAAARFLPLGLRQALSFHGRAAVGTGEAEWVGTAGVERDDLVSLELSAGVGHALRLWRSPADDARPAELWLESGLEAGWERADAGRELPRNPILRVAADVALAYRNTWGLFRFVLGYHDLPEAD
jgi:hypothetical protein